MIKEVLLATAIVAAPVTSDVKPEMVTISAELANRIVQMNISREQEVDKLKYEIFMWQQEVIALRQKMCA